LSIVTTPSAAELMKVSDNTHFGLR
jgi:hypothetical protein